jgi:hypothetical protein
MNNNTFSSNNKVDISVSTLEKYKSQDIIQKIYYDIITNNCSVNCIRYRLRKAQEITRRLV